MPPCTHPPIYPCATSLGIYIHIPFCQAICSYCNFNRGLLDPDLKRRYVAALEREIRATPGAPAADTIFFGGGTPSLLDPAEIARLLDACRETFNLAADAEITLEANPETITAGRLAEIRAAGVTRVSVGVQSFDDAELARLGRVHSAARAESAVREALDAGFASVSLDLMLWLPAQTRASWRRTVERAVALAPPHLSLYLLELYPNAPLKEAMAREGWSQTPDDDAADMYLEGLALLDAAGLEQYEISNVAQPGHRCRHNVKYWQGGSWYGYGCGAHATVGDRRWQNVASTADYIALVEAGAPARRDERRVSPREAREEALFLGLRLTDGVDRAVYLARHGEDPWQVHGDVFCRAAEAGLLWSDGARFGLTRSGMLVSNDILAALV